jgi:5-hydroxyisourate hydrolase-like protein (transthyretin family)
MIVAQADGYTSEKEQRIEAGTNNLEIELAVLGGVQGRVIDAISGEAVTKFSVALRQFNAGHLGRAQNKANGADGDVPGAFVVTGLATGDYAVEITANGYAPSMSETFRIDQGTVTPDVVVRMSAGGALAGRIVDATGRPVADAIVTTNDNGYVKNPLSDILGGLQARTTTGRSTRTDADGRFELDMLRPETYQLEVEHPDYTKQITRDLRVVDGSVVEVPTISMTSGGILRGMVYGVDGLPAAGAKVSLQGTGQVGIVQPMQAIAGPDGRYTIRRIAGGTYKVSATRPNAETSGNPFDMILDMRKSEQTIDIVEGGEHGVDLRLGGG